MWTALELSLYAIVVASRICDVYSDCGVPAIPSRAVLHDIQLRYDEGRSVKFSCKHPAEIVTEETLEIFMPKESVEHECKKGQWIGKDFRCAKPSDDFVDTIEVYNGNVVAEKVNMSAVKPKKVYSNVDSRECISNFSSGMSKKHSLVMDVTDGIKHRVDVLKITFDKQIPEMLVDYDSAPVEVFADEDQCQLNFPNDCGFPEIPLHAQAVRKAIKAWSDDEEEEEYEYVYDCLKYSLSGEKVLICDSEGQWSGKAPQCVPRVMCELPPKFDHIENNRITISNRTRDAILYENAENVMGTLTAVPNTIAVYLCRGLRSYYVGSRICNHRGIWEGVEPSCQKGKDVLDEGDAFA
ncbi:hypothetical protein B4U79_16278 [Dinothrombium tinctorium]|uniref:Sushi domain-containing protein n=1 Tax=Dinothrombium tinctorium TaxID=1965070 RepID=A0A443RNQ1_9ACAR|nr:hypothetical protein B4U79_16278 [Dinothrombium tinctorium]